jgi:hypothetical protein
MCWQCDNPGESFAGHLIDVMDVQGWAVTGPLTSAEGPGWLYTVGLPARFAHPELLIADTSDDAHSVLNAIAGYIRDSGRTIEAGQTMGLGDRVYGFGAVSGERRRNGEIHWSVEVHRLLGITKVHALEVVRLPEHEYCDEHFEEALRSWMGSRP